ncbi:MAG: class I tRNA ligase family protein [bacterium]|nr:class I tRNA ligase family protein [bacterium]MDZ4285561.1 class I tRNA ligase family protein [Candidatus Sungbacteria bacterium]
MKENNKFFITTAIPYVNARPHIGFALEIVQTDAIARWRRQQGDEVKFLTGTDENALKNVQAAFEAGREVKEFVAENAELFKNLLVTLNISNDDFIRTSAEDRHIKGAQKLWSSCKSEDIYKKIYKGLYCLGCEEFKLEKDLVNGECPEHPGKKIQEVEEENYFFRLSAYQDKILKLIESEEIKIVPEGRRNETLGFVRSGLEDFSISRSSQRAKHWGVQVPGDPSQVMYVWFDALSNYINALGYADNTKDFQEYWERGETLHVIGKGINRFHGVYWPAMLMSARVALPKKIFIHGYVTVDGQKMSKTIGNVIDPIELVEKYGIDPVRYYLLREIPSGEDGDFSQKKFEERYNGDLANGLGNLVARVTTLGEKVSPMPVQKNEDIIKEIERVKASVQKYMEAFHLNEALGAIWELISFGDKYINDTKPWTIKDDPVALQKIIADAALLIDAIRYLIDPFLPDTAKKIGEQIVVDGNNINIRKSGNLFPRLS